MGIATPIVHQALVSSEPSVVVSVNTYLNLLSTVKTSVETLETRSSQWYSATFIQHDQKQATRNNGSIFLPEILRPQRSVFSRHGKVDRVTNDR